MKRAAASGAAEPLRYAEGMTGPSLSRRRHLWYRALPTLLVALIALGCAGPRVTDEAARFQLPTLEGERLGPPDFLGQAVVVDFWATWCAPCHVQAEILEALYAEFQDRPVQFLAVNTGEREEVVREWVASKPFPYPVLLDPDERLSEQLGILGLPTIMVVSRQGEVLYMAPGIVNAQRLRSLLAEAGA